MSLDETRSVVAASPRRTRLLITGGIVPSGTLRTNGKHPHANGSDADRERHFLGAVGAIFKVAIAGPRAIDGALEDQK